MAFDGSEGEQIDLRTAQQLTSAYRNSHPEDIKAIFIGKELIQRILDQDDCMGIRLYYGEEADGAQRLVLVGAKADEKDMTEGVMADRGSICPPKCDQFSPLNQ